MALYEDVQKTASQTIENQGHTVGDALGAYGAVQKLQQDKQDFEMKQQQNEMNKATWFGNQIKALQQNTGPARQAIADGLLKQAPTIYPQANPDTIKMLAKDPELTPAAAGAMEKFINGTANADDLKNLSSTLSQQPADVAALLKEAAANRAQVQASQLKNQGMVDVRQQMVDLSAHNKAIEAITKNPLTNQLLVSSQNLSNAKSNFLKGGATPQEFAELQNAVRSNLGIKGTGGVDEREATYFKSLGLSTDKLNQFLTSAPKSVMESDPKFASTVMGLVDNELGNKSRQAESQIEKLSHSYKSYYDMPRNAERKIDFENTKQATLGQFAALSPPQSQTPSPGSIVNHEGTNYKFLGGDASKPESWQKQ